MEKTTKKAADKVEVNDKATVTENEKNVKADEAAKKNKSDDVNISHTVNNYGAP